MVPADEDETLGIEIVDDGDTDGVEYPADSEAPAEPAVAPESALINIVEPRTPEQITVDQFVEKIQAERNAPVVVHTPPPMTERQLSAREQEMQAGAARVKHFETQQANRPQPKPEPPNSTPVFVPKEGSKKDMKFGGGTPVG